MHTVHPKKSLGQHFLKDENIARKIVGSLEHTGNVLEIGPGTGVLTKHLLGRSTNLKLIEIDEEAVAFLKAAYPGLDSNIIHGDFLHFDLQSIYTSPFAIIGNFPYNISSQIFFKIIRQRQLVPEVVGMIQKEVAERLTAPPGNKTYGILTVLLGAFYDIRYLFTVSENVFVPPPKVKSAVIRLVRKDDYQLKCDEQMLFAIVKAAFNQRRKTMRNSLRNFWQDKLDPDDHPVFKKRPEQLSVDEFTDLVNLLK